LDIVRRSNVGGAMKNLIASLPMLSRVEDFEEKLDYITASRSADIDVLFDNENSDQIIYDILLGKKPEFKEKENKTERICIVAMLGHISGDTLLAWKPQLRRYMQNLLAQGKDVTLFSDYPESESNVVGLEDVVPRGVRIIYRIAERVMNKKEIVESSYIIRNLVYSDQYEKDMELMNWDNNRRDLTRSMGQVSFDKVIYAGPYSTKFVLLAKGIEADRYIYWDQRNYSVLTKVVNRPERFQMRYENITRVPEIFDQVYHWDETEYEIMVQNDLIKCQEKHSLIKDHLDYKSLLDHDETEVVDYNGNEFWLTEKNEYLDGQCVMKLLKKCGTKTQRKAVHIDYSDTDNIDEIMREIRLRHQKQPEDIFYIFEDFSSNRKDMELIVINENMQEYTVLCSYHILWNMLKEFSTYYYTADYKDIYENISSEFQIAYEKL
nr:hypothetical protein [Eubacterium sp.]